MQVLLMTFTLTGGTLHAAVPEAEQLVDRYLSALVTGNPQQAFSLLGGDLKKDLDKLKKNARYAAQLKDVYMGGSYELVKSEVGESGRITVHAILSQPDAEQISIQFIIKQIGDSLRIVGEL